VGFRGRSLFSKKRLRAVTQAHSLASNWRNQVVSQNKKPGENVPARRLSEMRKVGMAVAGLLLATAVATTQANAESTSWGPVRNGDQCYHNSSGWGGIFGYWTQCEGTAARAARTTLLHQPVRARRDPHNDR
jgi:hypothetical protein